MKIDPGQYLTREQVRDALSEGFGIEFGDRMLRYAIEALDVQVHDISSRPGSPGRPLTYYEPLLVWTIASIHHRERALLKRTDAKILSPFRSLASDCIAEYGWGFSNGDDLLAQLLLVGSPDLGIDPAHLVEHVRAETWLLDSCSEGREFLRACLDHWIDSYVSVLRMGDYDDPPASLSARREVAAHTFVRRFSDYWQLSGQMGRLSREAGDA